MITAKFLSSLAALALLLVVGGARAEVKNAPEPGVTSGPAAGKAVEPSASIQKENTEIDPSTPPSPGSVSAGAPGVEGKQGTQSGKPQ